MKTKTILILAISLLVFSCKFENKKETESKNQTNDIKEKITLKEKIDNEKITVLEETRNDSLRKVVVNLEISEKITERELKKIAKKIRKFEDSNKYDNIWIFYFLKETKENSGAWATTHFSPELEIRILGTTNKEEKKIREKTNSITGEIIGKWYEEQYTSSSFVLYKENGKIYGKTIFKNGQEMIENFETKEVDLGMKYFDKQNSLGEYFIVLKNGELGYYNKDNKQFTIGKIIK